VLAAIQESLVGTPRSENRTRTLTVAFANRLA